MVRDVAEILEEKKQEPISIKSLTAELCLPSDLTDQIQVFRSSSTPPPTAAELARQLCVLEPPQDHQGKS